MKLLYSIPLLICSVISVPLSFIQHPFVSAVNLAGVVVYGKDIIDTIREYAVVHVVRF